MRWTSATAARHRSNSSFCGALKLSSSLGELQILLGGIRKPSTVSTTEIWANPPLVGVIAITKIVICSYALDAAKADIAIALRGVR